MNDGLREEEEKESYEWLIRFLLPISESISASQSSSKYYLECDIVSGIIVQFHALLVLEKIKHSFLIVQFFLVGYD